MAMREDRKYRVWTRMEETRLAELVARRVPREEIASRFGRSCSAITARITRLGIAVDMRRPFSAADDHAIREGRKAGASYAAIARQLGRSEGSIKGRARWLGAAVKHRSGMGVRKPPRRKCLKHGGVFQPGHRYEFVCAPCKEGEDWLMGPWMA